MVSFCITLIPLIFFKAKNPIGFGPNNKPNNAFYVIIYGRKEIQAEGWNKIIMDIQIRQSIIIDYIYIIIELEALTCFHKLILEETMTHDLVLFLLAWRRPWYT